MKKRWICLIAALMMLALGGTALAERAPEGWKEISLPDSTCTIMVPSEMEYDGPYEPDGSEFAWLSEKLGLELDFFCYDAQGTTLDAIRDALAQSGQEVVVTRIGDTDMVVYRIETDDPVRRCIGYVFLDGRKVQEISFWYANQTAADMTKTIMESFKGTGTV